MTPLTDRDGHRKPNRRRRVTLVAGVLLAAATSVGGALPAAARAHASPPSATGAARAAAPFEVLTLGCAVRQSDEVAGVRCRWSAPTLEEAAGLRLLRITVGGDEGRRVVFRTDDLTVTTHTDTPVRPGRRYIYVVQAVDEAGRTVGLSRRALVAVPQPDDRPDVEVIRLECRLADDAHVGCAWTLPTEPGARTLTLWRTVDGGARERVVSARQPFRTAYRDAVPAGTSRVAYAVIATDGAGEVVARSSAAHLVFRDTRPVDTRPVDTRPVDTRPVDTRPVDTRPVDTRPVDTRPVDRVTGRSTGRLGSAG